MRILTQLIDRMDATLKEAEKYIDTAHALKSENKSLADTYCEASEMHLKLYMMFHEKAVKLIEEQKAKGVEVPASMLEIWAYEHKKLVEDYLEIKYKCEEYRKGY